MPYRMEYNNIDGLPGLMLMGAGVFFIKVDTLLAIVPSNISAWLGAFSFLCSAAYYVYKLYTEYKNNNKNPKP